MNWCQFFNTYLEMNQLIKPLFDVSAWVIVCLNFGFKAQTESFKLAIDFNDSENHFNFIISHVHRVYYIHVV